MLLSRISSHINSLTVQIFALFWLTFSILLALAFFVPTLDARAYTELKGDDLRYYQNEVVIAIRHNHISRLLNSPMALGLERRNNESYIDPPPNMPRPVLVNSHRAIIGAKDDDVQPLQKFIYQSDNPAHPMTKRFFDVQISGPFLITTGQNKQDNYMLYFVRKVNPQQEFISFIFDHPFIMLLLFMLISSPLLLWLAWSISRPMRRFLYAANAVALGNFQINKELEEDGTREFRLVGRSFNQMIKAIDELISNKQRLLSAISHELRTPLTRLQLAAALMRRRKGECTELTRIDMETERLDKMINDLLLLSRQQLNSHLLRDTFPINEIWEDIFSDAQFEAEQRHLDCRIQVQIDEPTQHFINGNLMSLSSAIENVIRNALKYTNSKIQVSVYLENKSLMVQVDDDGPGVPPEEYDQIFEPFYRVDAARTRETGGTGLGLAIVANAIKQHQGEVWADKSPLGGLQIMIKLPLWID
ncbi:envelope stress sensor histidine kinase CpxA [Volucribacter amazonae]|uniref:histidine kinase n=1 Tax=Volucribacter amazonae TaxID=256731 RepID=A0A9X4PER8_9PAST|nr:envelope stress sensor histidine kinase CpxA [Volucribacter amazonae]MDG6895909.1 two-component system sensor histidine kinase CpxA [Volucribacter amazonae]